MIRRAALGVTLALSLAACDRSTQPCMGVGTCPEGTECLANRCTLLGADPVAADTRRLVALPSAMAVIEADQPESDGELPPAITFGSAHGASALYLRFAPLWRGAKSIESAFLVLEPMPGTRRGPNDVEVDVWRVGGAWSPDELEWLAQPELVPPRARGLARAAPPMPLRIDVTEIVRYFAANERSDHGFALRAGSGELGASFATGASGGAAPRLELYVR